MEIKTSCIDEIISQARLEFARSYKSYHKKLKLFAKAHIKEISIARMEKMLQLTSEQVRRMHRKTEQKKNRSSFEDFPDDHLPFRHLIMKIAESMPDAPVKPKYSVQMTPSIVEKEFESYSSKFRTKFLKIKRNLENSFN